jgi:hypothetical protein
MLAVGLRGNVRFVAAMQRVRAVRPTIGAALQAQYHPNRSPPSVRIYLHYRKGGGVMEEANRTDSPTSLAETRTNGLYGRESLRDPMTH